MYLSNVAYKYYSGRKHVSTLSLLQSYALRKEKGGVLCERRRVWIEACSRKTYKMSVVIVKGCHQSPGNRIWGAHPLDSVSSKQPPGVGKACEIGIVYLLGVRFKKKKKDRWGGASVSITPSAVYLQVKSLKKSKGFPRAQRAASESYIIHTLSSVTSLFFLFPFLKCLAET